MCSHSTLFAPRPSPTLTLTPHSLSSLTLSLALSLPLTTYHLIISPPHHSSLTFISLLPLHILPPSLLTCHTLTPHPYSSRQEVCDGPVQPARRWSLRADNDAVWCGVSKTKVSNDIHDTYTPMKSLNILPSPCRFVGKNFYYYSFTWSTPYGCREQAQ